MHRYVPNTRRRARRARYVHGKPGRPTTSSHIVIYGGGLATIITFSDGSHQDSFSRDVNNRPSNIPTVDGPVQNMTKDARKVVIEGARRKEDEYTLDTTGFQFSRRPKHTRFQDDKAIKAEYYPECMEIIKQLTGAARVIPFHHCMLSTCPLTQSSTYPRYPGSYPSPESRWSQWCFGTSPAFINHPCRFHTTAFAISLLHKHFPNEIPALLRNRLHITNLWRPISRPAID